MSVVYDDTNKNLPSDQIHRLFMLAGWSDGKETPDLMKNFNLPFINATLVISAWKNERLIGVVRVLSDKIIRSVIYDLVIDPNFQGQGIGQDLVTRCITHFPNTEWLVQTTEHMASYYEQFGFKKHEGIFLSIPSKWVGKN